MARSKQVNQVKLRYNFVGNKKYATRIQKVWCQRTLPAVTRIQKVWRRLSQEFRLFHRLSVVHYREQRSINRLRLEQRFPNMLRRAYAYDTRMERWRNNHGMNPNLTANLAQALQAVGGQVIAGGPQNVD